MDPAIREPAMPNGTPESVYHANGIDPDGKYLLVGNQKSDSVVVLRIDQLNGKLSPTGTKIELGAPVCVKFVR
jgi:6-phosphogluconolactonase (cycloisomerase 2 family)